MTFIELPWEDMGYKKHDRIQFKNPCNPYLYQKTIWNDGKKLYWINFEYWDLSLEFSRDSIPKPSVVLDARLYTSIIPGTDYVEFHIEFSNPDTFNVTAIEEFLAKQYIALECIPDIHNND